MFASLEKGRGFLGGVAREALYVPAARLRPDWRGELPEETRVLQEVREVAVEPAEDESFDVRYSYRYACRDRHSSPRSSSVQHWCIL